VYFGYYLNGDLTIEPNVERWRWYEQPASPWGLFNGVRSPQVVNEDEFYQVYDDMIVGARAQPTVLEMWLDESTTRVVADSQLVRVGVHINPTDSAVDRMENLMLTAVLFEDSIPYESHLHPGDTAYARMVVRRVIADTWGIPLSLGFGTEFDTTLEAMLGVWQLDRLGVAVFVQDTVKGEVLQSVGKRRIGE
jgi:hypothetical protein